MKMIINKILGKKFLPVIDRKFVPVIDRKFVPVTTERERLIDLRRQGFGGNGECSSRDFYNTGFEGRN